MPKKDVVLTIRVDEEMSRAIQSLAEEDERTTAWMVRKLIGEALTARGVFNAPKDKRTTAGNSQQRPGGEPKNS